MTHLSQDESVKLMSNDQIKVPRRKRRSPSVKTSFEVNTSWVSKLSVNLLRLRDVLLSEYN